MVANLTTRLGQLTSSPAGGPYTGANKIINGDMAIDQRNAGATVLIGATQYTVDRWAASAGAVVNKYTVGQNYGGVTPPVGFTNYLGCKTTTAYTPGSTDAVRLYQGVEGLNCSDLNWGTANAKTVTLSFWVYSSLIGTWSGAVQNNAGDRTYPFSFSISVASTWELKTVTIAGDTSGTWLTSSSAGLYLYFALGCGSTKLGTASAWAAAGYYGVTGANQMLPVLNTTFYMTGLKLEVGSIATPFVPDDYAVSLAKCQRYCQVYNFAAFAQVSTGQAYTTAAVQAPFQFPAMRAAPTVTVPAVATSGAGFSFLNSSAGNPATQGTISAQAISATNLYFQGTGYTSGFAAGNASILQCANTCVITLASEL